MIQKFTDIANNPTTAQMSAAQSWYDEANDLAYSLTELGDLDFDQACCIIAAFSIRQRWSKNVELATRFAQGERNLPALGTVNRIAENVVAFDDPYTALNGQKTNAFAHNIAGDLDAVTVDVWMLKAAGEDHTKSPNKTKYNAISDAIRIAAANGVQVKNRRVYLKPAQYQALVWIIIRGEAK